jgi:hypothetical protein
MLCIWLWYFWVKHAIVVAYRYVITEYLSEDWRRQMEKRPEVARELLKRRLARSNDFLHLWEYQILKLSMTPKLIMQPEEPKKS